MKNVEFDQIILSDMESFVLEHVLKTPYANLETMYGAMVERGFGKNYLPIHIAIDSLTKCGFLSSDGERYFATDLAERYIQYKVEKKREYWKNSIITAAFSIVVGLILLIIERIIS